MPTEIETYDFELGLTYVGMVNVEDDGYLEVPPHPWEWKPGATRYHSSSGEMYYDGYPQATWRFGYLTVAAWQWLLTHFSGNDLTADVYVKTKKPGDTYQVYTAKMHQPIIGEEVARGHAGFYDVAILFTHMVEYSP